MFPLPAYDTQSLQTSPLVVHTIQMYDVSLSRGARMAVLFERLYT